MASPTPKQQGYKLYAEWKKLYKENTVPSREYRGNIHRDSNMLSKIIEDVGYDTALAAMRHYMLKNRAPEFIRFVYNYDSVITNMELVEQDLEERAKLREQTRLLMEEYLRDN